MTVIAGDCREEMFLRGPYDLIIADPPYGDTSLAWDRIVSGWETVAAQSLKPTGSMWVFGSMRMFMATGQRFSEAGLKIAQDIVWEKHNGSGMAADRFRRVHEHVVQFYRCDARWVDVFNEVQKTPDATAKTARRKTGPAHFGRIKTGHFTSRDGGPRMMRSVVYVPSAHGAAIHPTEKPSSLIEILVRTSCPPNGLVGDFFAGSGSAGEACKFAGRRYVGCEID